MTVEVSKLSVAAVMEEDQEVRVPKLSAVAVMEVDQELLVYKLSAVAVLSPVVDLQKRQVICVT